MCFGREGQPDPGSFQMKLNFEEKLLKLSLSLSNPLCRCGDEFDLIKQIGKFQLIQIREVNVKLCLVLTYLRDLCCE